MKPPTLTQQQGACTNAAAGLIESPTVNPSSRPSTLGQRAAAVPPPPPSPTQQSVGSSHAQNSSTSATTSPRARLANLWRSASRERFGSTWATQQCTWLLGTTAKRVAEVQRALDQTLQGLKKPQGWAVQQGTLLLHAGAAGAAGVRRAAGQFTEGFEVPKPRWRWDAARRWLVLGAGRVPSAVARAAASLQAGLGLGHVPSAVVGAAASLQAGGVGLGQGVQGAAQHMMLLARDVMQRIDSWRLARAFLRAGMGELFI